MSPTSTKRTILRAVCDTCVPAVEKAEDHRDFFARKASDLGVETLASRWRYGAGLGIEDLAEALGHKILTTTLSRLIGWGRGNSVWPVQFGLACCAIEMIDSVTPTMDISRFGSEILRASPRQADLMIVSGRVSQKMAPVLRTVYDQMPEPKWVISMGACASTGGVFNNYALLQGVDKIVPVDVYIPGCPPRPEDLINALMILQERIKTQGIMPRT